jgi:glycosyltransferase involved in cell wall biosynthesis
VKTAVTISIAMCTYNGETFLSEQLESILAQTVLPDELIVCDDASIDATVDVLRTFKEKSPFPVTIIVNKSTAGVCKNFENAIGHCSGDVIVFADQDDIWQPFKIESMIAAFHSNPHCGYVFSNADLVDEQGRYIGRDLWKSIGFDKRQQADYARGDQLHVMLRGCCLIYGTTMAFRGVFKTKLLPIESRLVTACTHDTWISLMLTSMGLNGVAIPRSLIRYRQHEKQLAGGGQPLKLSQLITKARSSRADIDLALADSLAQIAERLQNEEQQSESVVRARKQLTEKALHLRARVRANSSHGFQRLKVVFLESVSGRYGRYSGSLKSIVKDLISG